MQLTNLTLSYLVAEAQPLLRSSIVRKVQELPSGWLKMKLQTHSGSKDLVIAPSAFFFTSFALQAKQLTSGYGASIRKRIQNKRIIGIEQHGADRIAVLSFDNCTLVMELFASGNIVLVDEKGEI
ncbi:MAG: NFACT family protein, partial [Candidatus Diapherotrites archaeon]|nr:NFACT family protein [Candidatus Diapherotrites archaeon]